MIAALRAEDARITKEQEISEKSTRDAATSASGSDPRPPGSRDVPPEIPQQSENIEQIGEDMQVDPTAASDSFATDRIPMDVSSRDDRVPSPSTRATKKSRPTSDAQMAVDDRPRAAIHARPDSDMGSLVPKPPVHRPRVEDDMTDISSLRILSSLLRGVDITEVYSPQRVVEVCHKYHLI